MRYGMVFAVLLVLAILLLSSAYSSDIGFSKSLAFSNAPLFASGNVKVTAINDRHGPCCSIYDSVNHFIYVPSTNSSLILILKNGKVLKTLSSFGGSGIDFSEKTGNVFVLTAHVMKHNGCDLSYLTIIARNNSIVFRSFYLSGLTGPVAYGINSGLVYFASGGTSGGGNCSVGVYAAKELHPWDFSFIPAGPQPSPSGRWYEQVPALAYNAGEDVVYVPTINSSASNETKIYALRGDRPVMNSEEPVVTLAGQTVSMLYDSDNRLLYVEQNASNQSFRVFVINSTNYKIIGKISLTSFGPIVLDSSNKLVYVFEKRWILEISGAKVVQKMEEPTKHEILSASYDAKFHELVAFYFLD